MTDYYARQRILPQIGPQGQQRLGAAKVLVVGCGALGTAQAQLLARAGVGHLVVVDRDRVDISNLQRQLLYDASDARERRFKAKAAAARLRAVNPGITVEPRVLSVGPRSVRKLLEGCDLAMDATDNVETRYVLNDACVQAGVPWVYGGAVGTEGLVMPVVPGVGPCLRCAFPDPPPTGTLATCDTAGVLNANTAATAALQVAQGLRLLLADTANAGKLTSLDVWKGRFHTITVPRDPGCPCCGARRFPFLRSSAVATATTLCGEEAVQVTPAKPTTLGLPELAARLQGAGSVDLGEDHLVFHDGDHELLVFGDGTVLVNGTRDPDLARSLVARFVGS
jgi:molybdopterin/thiamine biosynthesis adenylyltransferase